jgi:hypothetical protein
MAQCYYFKRLISIELSDKYFQRAKTVFVKYPHIEILKGDSAELLPGIVKKLNTPALFWLDGQYSGGDTALGNETTPVLKELAAVFQSHLQHIILIDDARLFNGEDGYPPLSLLKEYISKEKPSYSFETAEDIIRLYPAK